MFYPQHVQLFSSPGVLQWKYPHHSLLHRMMSLITCDTCLSKRIISSGLSGRLTGSLQHDSINHLCYKDGEIISTRKVLKRIDFILGTPYGSCSFFRTFSVELLLQMNGFSVFFLNAKLLLNKAAREIVCTCLSFAVVCGSKQSIRCN